ncbi:hypothetical protein LguiA_036314 [Lonicera macranthoides]
MVFPNPQIFSRVPKTLGRRSEKPLVSIKCRETLGFSFSSILPIWQQGYAMHHHRITKQFGCSNCCKSVAVLQHRIISCSRPTEKSEMNFGNKVFSIPICISFKVKTPVYNCMCHCTRRYNVLPYKRYSKISGEPIGGSFPFLFAIHVLDIREDNSTQESSGGMEGKKTIGEVIPIDNAEASSLCVPANQ